LLFVYDRDKDFAQEFTRREHERWANIDIDGMFIEAQMISMKKTLSADDVSVLWRSTVIINTLLMKTCK